MERIPDACRAAWKTEIASAIKSGNNAEIAGVKKQIGISVAEKRKELGIPEPNPSFPQIEGEIYVIYADDDRCVVRIDDRLWDLRPVGNDPNSLPEFRLRPSLICSEIESSLRDAIRSSLKEGFYLGEYPMLVEIIRQTVLNDRVNHIPITNPQKR